MSKKICVELLKCFWCNEDIGVAIPKELKDSCNDNYEGVFMDYEPCDKCKENWEKGDVIIEAQNTPVFKDQPPIGKDAYPTGNNWIIKKGILEEHIFFATKEVTKELGLYTYDEENDE